MKGETRLKGIGGSPGICIGKAYLVDREGVDVVEKYFIEKKELHNEKNRFKVAVKRAEDELHKIIEHTPEELRQHSDILATHVVLLKDKMLYGRTIDTIQKERVNAEWALKTVMAQIKNMFQSVTDPYLKERASDIVQVSERIMQNLVGAKKVRIGDIDQRVILVAHDLSPAEASQIQLERIKGFVTDRGGRASHTSIIARTLGIPAVLGLDNATDIIRNDDIIVVDGAAGLVIVNPDEKTLVQIEERRASYENYRATIKRSSHLPAKTTDDVRVPVMGNIELPEEVVSVIDHGGEGIGLYRTEFQYLSRTGYPTEEELFDKYKDVVEVMATKPVTIRTLDINGDKVVEGASEVLEANPALGLRAIRYCLQKPNIFKSQLRAILRAAAFGNVRLLIPMISCYEEVIETKRLLREAAEELDQEGLRFSPDVKFGVMLEVPSAVIMAAEIAEEVDFYSIGTNDLIQYSMAIDRSNRRVAHLYSPLQPAIIRLLKQIADVSKSAGIELYMCGEMAGDPINLPILLGLQLDELSMNPQSIPTVKSIIRSISAVGTRELVQEALKQKTIKGVSRLIEEAYGQALNNKAYSS
jgi:phosphotransferase system enzyme I (PtsI)